MTIELEMLVWTAAFTAIIWVPYIMAHILNVGALPALTYKADTVPMPDWAQRAKKAHYNAIEGLATFAVFILVAHVAGVSNEATQNSAIVYFWLRLAHYFAYLFNVPFGRTLTFAGAWLSQLCIAYNVLFV